MRGRIVRLYTRSKVPHWRLTDDLNLLFIQVVELLGGERRATPKVILDFMDVKNLTISHVKSHLQMYRNKKKEESRKERRMMREMSRRQSQQYIQIYESARDATQFIQNQQRVLLDISEKIAPVLGSSNKSLYQSSSVRLNKNRDNDVVVACGGAIGEEELSLELTLGRKY
ncbi:unnamed protein product [Arabidopsis thaliana]|uniref:HTH myb-type domain-containing protein n=1 Tax=Arabidopsis thaliana TaxID=3702 RepID=A0A5S9XQA3_ARATH|nr:unnamed protein product [Arabidopsis thaliana]